MSCYNPIYAKPSDELNDNGKRTYKMLGSWNTFVKASFIDGSPTIFIPDPGAIPLPCGHCLGCRLDYSRNWADRMLLEYSACGKCAIFVTLTYDDDHIHHCDSSYFSGTLFKGDFPSFMKRLRERVRDICPNLRFYASGEYGDHTHRPHMHAIIFGLTLTDVFDGFDHVVHFGKFGNTYSSKLLTDVWRNGFVSVGDVSWNTFAYVSRYVMKKLNGSEDIYSLENVEPVFSLMSRRPGIGRPYLDLHPDLLRYSKISLGDQHGAKDIRVPSYFINTLELTDPDLFHTIKQERRAAALDSTLEKLLQTDVPYYSDILRSSLLVKERKIKSLNTFRSKEV